MNALDHDHGALLLVGSIARPDDGWDVADVFVNSAQTVGRYVSMLPDGELGDRSTWISYVAKRAYAGHPDLQLVAGGEGFPARSYDAQPRYAPRPGVDEIRLEANLYADEAIRSYQVFRRLRDEGVVPAGVRFLVALPLTESATRPFAASPEAFEVLWRAYRDAMAREIVEIVAAIPPADLALQWDMARETAAVEGVEFHFPDAALPTLPHDPVERCAHALAELAPAIPAAAWLGLHVCYGSLQHRDGQTPDDAHYVPIRDLGVAVDILNAGVRACGRRVEFVHMPVQLARADDDFYAPLQRLDVDGARVYLGLIDPSDGVEGALRRIDVARRHLASFGVATPCGWGRRPASERIEDLLELNRAVAEATAEPAGLSR